MRPALLSLLLLAASPVMAAPPATEAAIAQLQAEDTVLLDVRTPEEFAEGALPGAHNLELAQVTQKIAQLAPDQNTPLVVYCRSGRRAGLAEDALRAIGYRNVINGGGYQTLRQGLAAR